MQASDALAALALAVSIATAGAAYRDSRRSARTAKLTAYFHWNRERSRVDLPDRTIHVGYNLVVWNQGPAPALDIHLEVRRPGIGPIALASVEDGEFPLIRMDQDGRYPVQFAPDLAEFFDSKANKVIRRFDVVLRWTDGNGRHEKVIPLRRGQIGV